MEFRGKFPLYKRLLISAQRRFLSFGVHFMRWKEPVLLNTYDKLAVIYRANKKSKVLLVVSPTIKNNGGTQSLTDSLDKFKISYVFFTSIEPNPSLDDVEIGKLTYLKEGCDSIIAIGGGSVIDCAKGIGISITNKKNLRKCAGVFKIRHHLPLLSAIPTTCGSGSETSNACLISDKLMKEKFAIVSNYIVPRYVILDPSLLVSLPKQVFAYVSMDALTHAIESYLNTMSTIKTRKMSLKAIELITKNIIKGYENPEDLEAKRHMLAASYLAGKAFSHAGVGIVHALAHALGGKYDLPHGELNAIILPKILTSYLLSSLWKMDRISEVMGLETNQDKRQNGLNVIFKIREWNKLFSIPDYIEEIKEDDIEDMASRAYKEATPLYTTPVVFSLDLYKRFLFALKSGKDY
jgi:alcohol dehydrogenase class IV